MLEYVAHKVLSLVEGLLGIKGGVLHWVCAHMHTRVFYGVDGSPAAVTLAATGLALIFVLILVHPLSVLARRFPCLLLVQDLVLKELEVFAKDLDVKTVQVDCLSAGFVDTRGLLLDLLVLQDHKLLNG